MRDPVTVSRLQARSVRDLQPNQSERQGSGRREFLQATAAWLAAGASTLSFGAPAPQQPTSQVAPWYKTVYRRNVIDMHITDWNPQFLSEFDPETYVSMLRLSQVKSAVVYAQSHVGLCNFPTQVGRTHNGIGACRGIAVCDVGANRVIKQNHVLRHDRNLVPQRLKLDVPDVRTIDENASRRDVIKPREQIHESALARPT